MRSHSAAAVILVAAGCGGESGVAQSPTWHQDIAPMVARSCGGCHREGGIAPFALATYDQARPLAARIDDAVHSGQMPPWGAHETPACKPRFPWKDDIRLSAADKKTLRLWAEAGAPAGDPARAKPLPAPQRLDLVDRNTRLTMAKAFVTEGDRDQFRCFPLPHVFDQDVWLTGVQVVPGNDKVVHHVLVWLDETSKSPALAGAEGSYQCFGGPGFSAPMLGAWAPGANPVEPPPDVGLPVKKGSRIVLAVHYHPAGRAEQDQSALDLRWTTTKPTYETLVALIGNFRRLEPSGDGLQPGPNDPPTGAAFSIPAGVRDHVETQRFTVPSQLLFGARLWAVGTHMHYVGTSMRIEIDRAARVGGPDAAEPARECLLETPRWDFNWQRGYVYDGRLDTLPSLRTGDVLHMRCSYDNTLENPHVREALAETGLTEPREVKLGEQTLDEMCLGVFGFAVRARP